MTPKNFKPVRIKNKKLIKAFFHEYKIAETLNIPVEDGLETFFNCIYIEILDGHNPQRAAEETLRLMEGQAASHAAKTNNFNYQLVGEFEDQLADVITKTIALEIST